MHMRRPGEPQPKRPSPEEALLNQLGVVSVNLRDILEVLRVMSKHLETIAAKTH